MKADCEFRERITRDLGIRKAACRILDVSESVDEDKSKKANWRVAIKYRPGHSGNTPDANRKFA